MKRAGATGNAGEPTVDADEATASGADATARAADGTEHVHRWGRIEVRVRRIPGEPGGAVFVLVHGAALSARYFGPLAQLLRRRGDVLLVDLPGARGLRAPGRILSLAGQAAVVHRAVLEEGVREAVLLGQSMGCQVVVEMMRRWPAAYRRAVMVGPPADARERSLAVQYWRYMQSAFREPLPMVRTALGDYAATTKYWGFAQLPLLVHHPIEQRIAELEPGARIAVVRGEEDRIVRGPWAQDLAERVPGTAVVRTVRGAAHTVVLGNPAEVAAVVDEVLALDPEHGAGLVSVRDVGLPPAAEPAGADTVRRALTARDLVGSPRAWAADYVYAVERLVRSNAAGFAHWVSRRLEPAVSRLRDHRPATDHAAQHDEPALRPPTEEIAADAEAGQVAAGPGTPVLILPGIYETWRFLAPLADHLRKAGHEVHVVDALGWNHRGVTDGADAVAKYLEEKDLRGVVLVAHSKGGLVGKAAMLSPAGERVAGLVAIATPWNGSAWARLFPRFTPVGKLSPDNQDLLALASERAVDARIVSVAPSWDPHIPGGSYLPGAHNVALNTAGHFRPLRDPATLDHLLDAVERLAALRY